MTDTPEGSADATHRHYKGGYYRFVSEAKHTETGEVMVVYEHVWPHARSMFVRPAELFYGRLANGGMRFAPLDRTERTGIMSIPAPPRYRDKWDEMLVAKTPYDDAMQVIMDMMTAEFRRPDPLGMIICPATWNTVLAWKVRM